MTHSERNEGGDRLTGTPPTNEPVDNCSTIQTEGQAIAAFQGLLGIKVHSFETSDLGFTLRFGRHSTPLRLSRRGLFSRTYIAHRARIATGEWTWAEKNWLADEVWADAANRLLEIADRRAGR